MKKYEVWCSDYNIKNIQKDNMAKEIEELINSYTDDSYNEINYHNNFKSFVPIFDANSDLEKMYFLFGDDEPLYYVIIKKGEETIEKEFKKHYLDIILKSNKIILDDITYKINEITFDVENLEVILECD